ncbi:MAG: dethiobiotin synthase [Rhodospirillales bacterium]
MRGVFVTGTGTGVGKTLVTAVMARQLRERGVAVRAVKPVITGFDAAAPSDLTILLEAQGIQATEHAVAGIAPWRFAPPISPDMAASRAGRRLTVAEMAAFVRYAARDGSTLLVEGIGGVMVPLNDRETVLDWIAAAEMPAVLVAGSYLGTLSHTLTAISVMAARGIPLRAVIVSESPESPVPLSETCATVARFAAGAPVVALPRLAGGERGWAQAPDLAGFALPPEEA